MIQLRRDVSRQAATAQGGGREFRIGRRGEKISAEGEEHFRLSGVHCLNGFDGVEAVLAWRFEIKLRAESIQECRRGSFPNTNGAVALHVAVTTHRTHSRTRFADLA